MKKRRSIISLLLILIFFTTGISATFITDILAFTKMAAELSRQTRELKKIIEASGSLNEEFKYFKKRFLRIHKGLTMEELKSLINISDIEFYYNSPYVQFNKSDLWKEIWKDPKNLLKKYKYLKDKSHVYSNKLYKEDELYRERVNFRIKENESIYKDYENVLEMLSDTKKIILTRKERYKNIEKLIKKVNGQGATGKLMAIQNELKIEQIIKLDLLITALRVKMEGEIKEKIIRMNIAKKGEVERYLDRNKDEKVLKKYLFGK
ncbi:MAG: hypothetical protein ABFR75_05570 [Acidobacteriota bacterium]